MNLSGMNRNFDFPWVYPKIDIQEKITRNCWKVLPVLDLHHVMIELSHSCKLLAPIHNEL